MNILNQRVIEELNKAREELLSIRKDNLVFADINDWHTRWASTFFKVLSITGRAVYQYFSQVLNGYAHEKDVDVLDALRTILVETLCEEIKKIDSQVPVRSVLEDRIAKVKDRKLSMLLHEFNDIADKAPNHAAIGFRTVLCLLIQEKAKLVNPTSKLATTNDLQLKMCIEDAIKDGIFSKDDKRRLESFIMGGHKDTFDFVVHRSGETQLVNKDELNDAVNLLNNLLPSIVP